MPELIGREEDLAGLRIDDVMVRPAIGDDGATVGWVALIVLEHRHGDSSLHIVPWMLGMRPSEESARSAALVLLKGLLKGQKKARRDFPGLTDPAVLEDRSMVIRTVAGMEDEWRERRRPAPSVLPAPPPRKARAAKVPMVPMTPELTAWALEAKDVRARWKWSQATLAAEVGTSASRISLFERGEAGFPPDVIARIAEVLDLDHPA
jgi:DNA-binding XRE family transcriptional regulator